MAAPMRLREEARPTADQRPAAGPVDEEQRDQAADQEHDADEGGAVVAQAAGQAERAEDFRSERVDREQRHDRAGPEDRDEGHPLVRSSFAGYLADWLLDASLEFTFPDLPTGDPRSGASSSAELAWSSI